MRVLVTGSHGLIGGALSAHLEVQSHEVVRLGRGSGEPHSGTWDPQHGQVDARALDGVDAVVHLAGVGVAARRWSDTHRRQVRESRVRGTDAIARAVARADPPPAVLLSASAIGFYGDRGDRELSEDDGPGTGFLPGLCRAWEAATTPAGAAGVRIAHLRTGIVLANHGGALAPQLRLFRLGLGGRLGSGRQWTSWITLDDEVRAIAFALGAPDLRGPLNLTAPEPVTNAAFTRSLASALHRPALAAVPAAALRLVLGREMADELLLASARVLPRRLHAAGFEFDHPTITGALAAILMRS